MILQKPQEYTVCMQCEEVIRYDPHKDKDIIQIYHQKCGKIVTRYDERGRLYQYILEIGMGDVIARETVFNLPHLGLWQKLRQTPHPKAKAAIETVSLKSDVLPIKQESIF